MGLRGSPWISMDPQLRGSPWILSSVDLRGSPEILSWLWICGSSELNGMFSKLLFATTVRMVNADSDSVDNQHVQIRAHARDPRPNDPRSDDPRLLRRPGTPSHQAWCRTRCARTAQIG